MIRRSATTALLAFTSWELSVSPGVRCYLRGPCPHLGRVEHDRDPAIAVSNVLRTQGDDRPRQGAPVSPNRGHITLRSTRLADDAASASFREAVLLPDTPHGLPVPVGRYKFPEAISFVRLA